MNGSALRERLLCLATRDDPIDSRQVSDGNLEDLHHGGNARQADIGDRNAVAMAIRAGFLVSGKPRLDRLESGAEPIDLPSAPSRVVEPAGCRKILF